MHANLGDCRVREGKAESDHSGNVITATSPPCPSRDAAVIFSQHGHEAERMTC